MKKILILGVISLFILFFSAGCSDKNIEEAILGHWVTEEKDTSHMYVSEDTIIYISSSGVKEEFNYKVRSVREEDGEMNIRTDPYEVSDDSNEKIIKFLDEDRKSIEEISVTASKILEDIGRA